MTHLETLAHAAWNAALPLRTVAASPLKNDAGDTFLLLIQPEHTTEAAMEFVQDVVQSLALSGGVLSVIERLTGGLWVAAARWAQVSQCHVYINLDLLTIDPHAQDWGDYKIKPEQVEVQRQELTLKALFDETPALLIQVRKSELPDVMDALRTAHLAKRSVTVGKAWSKQTEEASRIDVYRDAKKQLSLTVAQLEPNTAT